MGCWCYLRKDLACSGFGYYRTNRHFPIQIQSCHRQKRMLRLDLTFQTVRLKERPKTADQISLHWRACSRTIHHCQSPSLRTVCRSQMTKWFGNQKDYCLCCRQSPYCLIRSHQRC